MKEFEGQDLSGADFWGVNLRDSKFRDVDLSGARISHARLVDVTIDAEIDRLVVNGVDVTAFVNASDEWYPLRAMLRPADETALRASWSLLSGRWAEAIDRATRLGDAAIMESVNDEFSFAETLRHLIFATDKWLLGPLTGAPGFSSIGLPNKGSRDFPWPGLDLSASPTAAEAVAAFREQLEQIGDVFNHLNFSRLPREVEVLENGWVDAIECVHVVFEEGFHHLRYALRDLAILEAR